MKFIILALFTISAFGTAEQNARLIKQNKALMELVKALNEAEVGDAAEATVERSVAQTANAPNCKDMVEYQSCKGGQMQQRLDIVHSRAIWGQTVAQIYMGGRSQDICQQHCDNFGVPGCCEYQEDHSKCFFTPYLTSTTKDTGTVTSYYGAQSVTWPARQASICTISDCNFVMSVMKGKKGECGWEMQDKPGRKTGGIMTPKECDDFCLNDTKCMFASLSSSGYCHTFQTCNSHPGGTGWVTKQKVCEGHNEEFDVVRSE